MPDITQDIQKARESHEKDMAALIGEGARIIAQYAQHNRSKEQNAKSKKMLKSLIDALTKTDAFYCQHRAVKIGVADLRKLI